MISLKKQFVLAAVTVLLTACGGGGGGSTTSGGATTPVPEKLTDAAVQNQIASVVNSGFRWETAPTQKTVTVTVGGAAKAGLTVLVYRYTDETLGDGTVIQVPGDLVGSGSTGQAGTVALDLIADTTASVLVEVLDGPVKLETNGQSYRIVLVKDLATLAF